MEMHSSFGKRNTFKYAKDSVHLSLLVWLLIIHKIIIIIILRRHHAHYQSALDKASNGV